MKGLQLPTSYSCFVVSRISRKSSCHVRREPVFCTSSANAIPARENFGMSKKFVPGLKCPPRAQLVISVYSAICGGEVGYEPQRKVWNMKTSFSIRNLSCMKYLKAAHCWFSFWVCHRWFSFWMLKVKLTRKITIECPFNVKSHTYPQQTFILRLNILRAAASLMFHINVFCFYVNIYIYIYFRFWSRSL